VTVSHATAAALAQVRVVKVDTQCRLTVIRTNCYKWDVFI